MTPQKYDFKDRYKGDTSDKVVFTIEKEVNSISTPIDLTGASVEMHLKKSETSNDVIKVFEVGNGITVQNASLGIFELDSFIVDIPARDYIYDIKITLSSGVVRTYIKGIFKIIQDITY